MSAASGDAKAYANDSSEIKAAQDESANAVSGIAEREVEDDGEDLWQELSKKRQAGSQPSAAGNRPMKRARIICAEAATSAIGKKYDELHD